ncbi:hypothetical protein B0H13DRAFT_2664361, partial [Mycena leptocephala]
MNSGDLVTKCATGPARAHATRTPTHPASAMSAHPELPQQFLQLGGTPANRAKYLHKNSETRSTDIRLNPNTGPPLSTTLTGFPQRRGPAAQCKRCRPQPCTEEPAIIVPPLHLCTCRPDCPLVTSQAAPSARPHGPTAPCPPPDLTREVRIGSVTCREVFDRPAQDCQRLQSRPQHEHLGLSQHYPRVACAGESLPRLCSLSHLARVSPCPPATLNGNELLSDSPLPAARVRLHPRPVVFLDLAANDSVPRLWYSGSRPTRVFAKDYANSSIPLERAMALSLESYFGLIPSNDSPHLCSRAQIPLLLHVRGRRWRAPPKTLQLRDVAAVNGEPLPCTPLSATGFASGPQAGFGSSVVRCFGSPALVHPHPLTPLRFGWSSARPFVSVSPPTHLSRCYHLLELRGGRVDTPPVLLSCHALFKCECIPFGPGGENCATGTRAFIPPLHAVLARARDRRRRNQIGERYNGVTVDVVADSIDATEPIPGVISICCWLRNVSTTSLLTPRFGSSNASPSKGNTSALHGCSTASVASP